MFEMLREHLVFPEIELAPLKYSKGRFVEIIRSEMVAAVARKRIKTEMPLDGNASTNSASGIVANAIPASSAPAVKQSALSEKMKNHLQAKAAREARAIPKRRGRPPRAKPVG